MKLIEEIKDLAQKEDLGISPELSDQEFIREFKDKVDWRWISYNQTLSETFIREFKEQVYWEWISIYQSLSEPFIKEHAEQVHWDWISKYQSLSEAFIREHAEQVHWGCISRYQSLSEEFIKEFDLTAPEHSWRYASDEEKKKAITKSGLYEVKGGWVYGWKSVDSHLRSVFKPAFRYEVGKTYESSCDFNCDEENSFGLSMWSKAGAESFHQGRMLRVRARLSEVGAMVHEKHKLRCVNIEVIEEI